MMPDIHDLLNVLDRAEKKRVASTESKNRVTEASVRKLMRVPDGEVMSERDLFAYVSHNHNLHELVHAAVVLQGDEADVYVRLEKVRTAMAQSFAESVDSYRGMYDRMQQSGELDKFKQAMLLLRPVSSWSLSTADSQPQPDIRADFGGGAVSEERGASSPFVRRVVYEDR
jgi:hypothetical protein